MNTRALRKHQLPLPAGTIASKNAEYLVVGRGWPRLAQRSGGSVSHEQQQQHWLLCPPPTTSCCRRPDYQLR